MLTLGNIFVLMLLATAGAWLWHNHGLRERALARVMQHCANLKIELLDGNVALKKIGFVKDASGRRRLARIYNFEFTVTGESRHSGTITQFGAHSAQIELALASESATGHGDVDALPARLGLEAGEDGYPQRRWLGFSQCAGGRDAAVAGQRVAPGLTNRIDF